MPFASFWNITLQFRKRNVSKLISSWSVNYYGTHGNARATSLSSTFDSSSPATVTAEIRGLLATPLAESLSTSVVDPEHLPNDL